MQLDQRDYFKQLLADYTLEPFMAQKEDGGYTIIVNKDVPRDILARTQEDAALIGYKVYRHSSPDRWLFHFVCVCPKEFYVTQIRASVITSNNLRDELDRLASETKATICTQGNTCYVIVHTDKVAHLEFMYQLIMSNGMRAELHFVDVAMHEDTNEIANATREVGVNCPRCGQRSQLPRYLAFSEDSSTLTCRICGGVFSVREVVW